MSENPRMEYPETNGADSDPDWEQLCRRNLGTRDTYTFGEDDSDDEDKIAKSHEKEQNSRKTMPVAIKDDLTEAFENLNI